jgi:hypothetical protein
VNSATGHHSCQFTTIGDTFGSPFHSVELHGVAQTPNTSYPLAEEQWSLTPCNRLPLLTGSSSMALSGLSLSLLSPRQVAGEAVGARRPSHATPSPLHQAHSIAEPPASATAGRRSSTAKSDPGNSPELVLERVLLNKNLKN